MHVSASWDGGIQVRYYLDDPEAFGLTRPTAPALPQSAGRQEGPMSEDAKAARRVLINRNKEWDAATTVRIGRLTGFLARRTLPKNVTAVLAASLTGARGLITESMSRGSDTAKALLGLEAGWSSRLEGYLQQHPGRAMHVALAVALGGIEQTLTRTTCRQPAPVTAAYLTTLAGWGYPLCPVERIAALLDTTTDSSEAGEKSQDDPAEPAA